MRLCLFAATLLLIGSALPVRAEDAPTPVLDPLFVQHCARCHNVNGINGVCPDLSTIGARRDEAYIRESIVDPNAYIVPSFPKDVMPRFALILKPEEVDHLVKYLLTLKGQYRDEERIKKGVKW
ncbi:MAG TPA: cytochrome c [bacterium]